MNLIEVLNEVGYLSHGYCLLWQPWLIALHAVPDLFIFLAYTSIPLTLLKLVRKRPDLAEYRGLSVLFCSFILLCGLSHLIGLVTLWYPVYAIHGTLKAVTAVVSVITAITLVPLVPQLANLPSPAQLRALNTRLRAEIQSHEETLERLSHSQKMLEARVADRTEELSQSNERLRVMARESVHRSNNMLTQIQSLARQTVPRNETGATWITGFDERIGAMARATEVVLQCSRGWTADVAALLKSELAELDHRIAENLEARGPDLAIRTEAAQQISLLLRELLALSSKRGALSQPLATAKLSWSVKGGDFVLNWQEEGAKDWSSELDDHGIEKRLLLQSIPMTLDGKAHFDGTLSVSYQMRVPVDGLKPGDRTEPIDRVTQAYPRTPSRLAKPAQSE
jgi:two-component sensor histidine kinase